MRDFLHIKKAYPVLLTAALFLFTACAPPVVRTTSLLPARFHEAARLKTVAVLPFDGEGGRQLAMELEGILAGISIDNRQFFTLVDRTVIERAIDEELRLAQTGFTDPATTARLGRMIGARGVYTGVISTAKVSDSSYREGRSRCATYVTKKDKKGREYQECGEWVNYTVNCMKRAAAFSFTPKLLDVESGRIIYSNNISQVADSSVCEDSGRALENEASVLGRARKAAVEVIRKDVAPAYITFEVRLMDDTAGLITKESVARFKGALEFAKGNRLDRACEIWGGITISSPYSPSVMYNLGVCSEVGGRLEEAYELYQKADRLLNKPDDRITFALTRVRGRMENQRKIREELEN